MGVSNLITPREVLRNRHLKKEKGRRAITSIDKPFDFNVKRLVNQEVIHSTTFHYKLRYAYLHAGMTLLEQCFANNPLKEDTISATSTLLILAF